MLKNVFKLRSKLSAESFIQIRLYSKQESIKPLTLKPRFGVQTEHLIDIIKSESVINWGNVIDDVLKEGNYLNRNNIDAVTMGLCAQHGDIETGLSYLSHLKEKNIPLNTATLSNCLRMYYNYHEKGNDVCKYENSIYEIYENLKKLEVFDFNTAENIILALSLTNRWKECLDVLEVSKVSGVPSSRAYSAIITAAFVNGSEDVGWNLLQECVANDRLPLPSVYRALLSMKPSQKIEKLLSFLADHAMHLGKNIVDIIKTHAERRGYTAEYTSIFAKGSCKSCHNKLQAITLSDEDFNHLRDSFFQNVILGKNVYIKSTPEEICRFKSFIDKYQPYDVVIDGLNVAYMVGTQQSPNICAKLLCFVVDHFASKEQKVIVLGRTHMQKWRGLKPIINRCRIFYAHDISQDDPLLLYSALSSGPATTFVSRDFMRGHKHLLASPKLRQLFYRWQLSRQHQPLHVLDDGRVRFKPPLQYLPNTQRNEGNWHIPCYSEEGPLEAPKTWLCLQKIK